MDVFIYNLSIRHGRETEKRPSAPGFEVGHFPVGSRDGQVSQTRRENWTASAFPHDNDRLSMSSEIAPGPATSILPNSRILIEPLAGAGTWRSLPSRGYCHMPMRWLTSHAP